MHHFLLANGGKNYYRCFTGLTGFDEFGNRKPYIYLCNTVQDEQGKIVPAGSTLAYKSENRVVLFRVGSM